MKKASRQSPQQSRLILEELEERRLFSGGIEGLIETSLESSAIYLDVDANRLANDADADSTAAIAERQTQEIVFVDSGVDNYQQLVDDLRADRDIGRDIEVVLLDREQDGIEQISEFLSHRDDLDAVHIISHGSDGAIELGNTSLNGATLEYNNLKIALWANAFAETGDLLIYGCNLAQSEVGQSLISELSSLTLTDVAASDDLTGAAQQGGDWILEFKTGSVETAVALGETVQADYEGVLDAYLVSNTNATGAGSLHQAILDANANTGVTDSITFNIGGGGPQTIAVDAGGLPDITDPIILDATTQPGYSGTPLITLDGSATPPSSGINGITLRANDSTVKGFIVINFADEGIEMDGSTGFGDNNTIQNNWVGIDRNGNLAGNAEHGIMISADASGNQIGGTGPNEGNVVGGNGFSGVIINENSDNNILEGNLIGVKADGISLAANGDHGVLVQLASDGNRIGGSAANAGNVISGNTQNGIHIDGTTDATYTTVSSGTIIYGNWIGTAGTGTTGVGNGNTGIFVEGTNTVIGGTGVNEGNVITNNANEGINLTGSSATGTVIQGNIIGLDPDGATGAGNSDVGIAVLAGADNTTIGGSAANAGNIISMNFEGIEINSDNNTIQGNYIGTDITGLLDRGNVSDDGIEIQNNATGNLIGGTTSGAGNLIAFNALDGINITSGSGNALLGNDIHSNGDQQIDIAPGANNDQGSPLLTGALTNGSQVTISGSLGLAADSYYRIEFFGVNQVYLGSTNVATDGAGNANFNAVITASVAGGDAISATATRSDAIYTAFVETSELATSVNAVANAIPVAVDDSYTVGEDSSLDSDNAWFDTDWLYSRTLSFDNSTRAENLVDFPVLIKLDSGSIDYGKTHDQGDDLRFFDQDGTPLAHEIELWDEAGTSYVWVKIPRIDANSAIDSIVMYYGNAGVSGDGQDPAGVWSDYQAAYHLNENPAAAGTVSDSAGNFDATNSASTDTAGFIGNAQDFNGVDQHIDLGDDRPWINNASGATLSIWMNADTTAGSGDLIGLTRNDPADTGASRITLIRNGDDIQMIARTMDDGSDSVSVSTSSNPLSAGQWHHITGSIDYASDINNIKIYVDGQLEGTFSHDFTLDAIPNTDSSHATIGSDEDGVSAFFDGQLDEARIADQVRSAEWVAAQYAAMTGNLVSVGYEQTVHGVLANDVDQDGDTLSVSQLNGVPAAVGNPTALPSGAILTLNSDGSFTYDTNAAFEALGAGDSTTDAFTYQVDDGNGDTDTATVTITINGVDDAPVFGGVDTGSVTEDSSVAGGNISASGGLTVADADAGESSFQAGTVNGAYGDLSIDAAGNWSYVADNSQAVIQTLDVGESLIDTLTVTSFDGSTHDIVITINGAEDAPVIGGVVTGSVTEDGSLTSTAALTISDVDTSDNPISFNDIGPTPGGNGYGTFEISGNSWTYTLNNGHAAVQALDVGESLTDIFTFTASDGSTQLVSVTIDGAEDAPTLDNAVADQTATEDVAFSFSFAANSFGDLDTSDTLTYTATLSDDSALPTWLNFDGATRTFSGTPSNADVGAIDIKITADDGSSTVNDTFTLTVNNTNDPAVFGGVDTGAVTEDLSVVGGNISAAGSLTVSDPDVGESSFQAATINGAYGDLVIDLAGNWSYSASNNQISVQALDAGESLIDTLSVLSFDGSSHDVVITINGAEDAPVIGGVASGTVAEDGTLVASDTLTITDADSSDNPVSFNDTGPLPGSNGYGSFQISGNTWTYTLNNGHAAVQALDTGESLSDDFTFSASDGSTQTVNVTINGAEDAPLIGGVASGGVAEDGALTASDTLTITDADTSDNPVSFNDVAPTLSVNGYGNFEITANTWTYTLNNAHPSVQALDVGESLTDNFTFTASDGSTQAVTVTIDGAEDAPLIGGVASGGVAEDGALTASDTLTITDVDASDNPVSFNDVAPALGANGYGNFEITANTWTYTLNNAHPSVQALDVGESLTDNFTFTASDGSTQAVTVTIDGAEDAPLIGGVASGGVAEDGALTASDTLTITDADTSDNPVSFNDVAPTLGVNGYGNFEITSNTWTYTLNNAHLSVQALDVGETLMDSFTFTASDGSTQTVGITINGAEDAPVIGGITTGAVAEDGMLSVSAALTISDTDASDNPIGYNDVAPTPGANGYGNFEITSNTWTYTLDNAHPAVQSLDVGETLTDSFSFTASDGSTQLVSVTINGAEDAPVIGGTANGSVAVDGNLIVSALLTISDADTSDNPIGFNNVAPTLGDNGYGAFEITGNSWTYTLDNSHAAVQALAVGQTLTDSHSFSASDGSIQVVSVTINGPAEAPAPPPPVVEPPPVEPPPDDEPPSEEAGDEGDDEPDPVLPEIVPLPQDTRPPAADEASAPVADDEPAMQIEHVSEVAVELAPDQAPLQALRLDKLGLQVSDDESLNEKFEQELLDRIDRMHQGMDDAAGKQIADDVEVQIVLGSTLSLTAGIVSWVLRGGSLLASLMSTVPLLNRFDPLPILKKREDREKVAVDDEVDDTDTPAEQHARRVDKMFSASGERRE